MLGRRPPVAVSCLWVVKKIRRTVHSAPSPALRNDRTDGTMMSTLFTLMSPVPVPVKLSVALIPASGWCSNVHDHVSQQQWDQLRRMTYRHAHNRCEICGGQGPEWPVECHEVWHDDDVAHVPTLVRLIALCPECHRTKYIGLAKVEDYQVEARSHLAQVNGWTGAETVASLAQVRAVREARSAHDWRLDFHGWSSGESSCKQGARSPCVRDSTPATDGVRRMDIGVYDSAASVGAVVRC